MRINELSKELGKANKEIIAFLNEHGVEVKSHMNNITDEQADMVRKAFGAGSAPKAEAKKAEPKAEVKPEEAKKQEPKDEKKADEPKAKAKQEEPQKKKLTAVFRPQNAQQPRKPRQKVDPSQTGRIITVAKKDEKPEPVKAEVPKQPEVKPEVKPQPQQQAAKQPEVKPEVKPQPKEEVKKAPLFEGRDRVTTFGNVFANQPKQTEKKPEVRKDNQGRKPVPSNQHRDANRQTRQDNRNNNQDNRNYQNRQNGQNGQNGQNSNQPDGEKRKPVRFENRNNRATPPAQGGFAKPNNGKQGKNNYKDKNDKKHRTEDGPSSKNGKVSKHPFIKPETTVKEVVDDDIKEIVIPETITIKDLASKLKLQPAVIVKKLFLKGQLVNVNSELTFEQAEEIALEYEVICTMEEKVDVIAELLKEDEEDEATMVTRPPVVCVMGHVDHGKTSLLDKIRSTNVTSREAGGITQAIGAYQVKINDRQITFLDTPGHEAFTSMRMRGANSTDIAILVVAADDGVMPQTIEAINHAKAAGIEIIVAVNKIDKPGANIDRVKQELTEYELIAEDWGGQTIFAPVSAKTGEGIEDLLEMILLTAEVLDLKSNPNRKARGLVIEAELDKGRGPVATVLVQKGTLHVGDFISAGAAAGKVRAMVDDKGRRVREAGPSTPVEILGLNDVPNAGEIFICHDNDKQAKSYAETFIAQNRAKLLEETKGKMSLDDLYSKIQEGNLKELNIIIKADVQGSVEAVKQSLLKLSNEEVVVKVIHGGVGAINESDVILASASSAIIIGFNVRPDAQAKSTAEHEGVDVRLYKVIYQAIEEMEAAMKGMLDAVYEEKVIGHAEVQQIFKASAIGNIAGARVMDGHIQRDCKVRITREGELIFEGELKSLKRFKDDVKEVKEGFECGLVFEEFDSMQEHDMVEAYIMVEVPRD